MLSSESPLTLDCFSEVHLKGGETVFVNGTASGVGSMVVQMARNSGARVITTVGSAEKAGGKRIALGAGCTVNYKTDDVPRRDSRIHRREGR